MSAATLILAAGLIASAASPVRFAEQVKVERRAVTLGEVADLSGVPVGLRERAAALPVAMLRPGHAWADAPVARLVERARAGLPALAPYLPTTSEGKVRIRLQAAPVPAAAPRRCAVLVNALQADAIPVRADLVATPCGSGPLRQAFRYDAGARAVRAVRDLAVDEVVPAPSASAVPTLRPGQPLYLTATVGPVTVSRAVKTVQAARRGRRVFVRAADGAVFSAPMPEPVQ